MLFPMSITVTISTPEQLQAFMAASVCAKPSPIAGTANKQEVKKPDPKPEAAGASAAPPAGTAGITTAEQTAAASGGKTVDDAKALTMKIVADKGRDAAVALLTKYGVPVAAKLPADQVAAFCIDAEAVLAS